MITECRAKMKAGKDQRARYINSWHGRWINDKQGEYYDQRGEHNAPGWKMKPECGDKNIGAGWFCTIPPVRNHEISGQEPKGHSQTIPLCPFVSLPTAFVLVYLGTYLHFCVNYHFKNPRHVDVFVCLFVLEWWHNKLRWHIFELC